MLNEPDDLLALRGILTIITLLLPKIILTPPVLIDRLLVFFLTRLNIKKITTKLPRLTMLSECVVVPRIPAELRILPRLHASEKLVV